MTMFDAPFSESKTAAEDFRERRELQGLGDSDGLGCDPTLESPSLAPLPRPGDPLPDWKRAGLLRARAVSGDEHTVDQDERLA